MIQSMKNPTIDIKDIISVTKELTAVLAAEVSLLKSMKVRDIEPLQRDKLRLAQRLDEMKHYVKQHPELVREASEEDLSYYKQVADDFEYVMIQNHNYLQMARQVNVRIIGAIKAAVKEQQPPATYTARGTDAAALAAASVRINQTF